MLPTLLSRVADASAAANALHSYIAPLVQTLCILASLACVFFLVNGGIQYMTSSGRPDKLESAKVIIRNALIGLVIVLGAAVLTTVLSHAYGQPGGTAANNLPALNDIKPDNGAGGLVGVLIKAVTGLLNDIVQEVAKPFLAALSYFTNSTPLIVDNSSVFNLWLVMVGIADVLFVLVVALLGFHVMSASTFGIEEIEFKHLLPRIALTFLLINSSVFLIDALIGLSNAMIHALQAGFSKNPVWDSLADVVKQSGGMGLAALLIMVAFLIFSVILLVYYVGRIVTLYLGAVLAPIVFLIWLLPSFRDFASTAAKTYIATIFVLFVHVTILELAGSLFTGMAATSPGHTLNPLMSLIVGIATLLALLKAQGVMMQYSYVSIGPRTARKLGGQFINGVSYLSGGKLSGAIGSKTGQSSRRQVPGTTPSKKIIGSASGSAISRPAKFTNYKQPTSKATTTSTPAKRGKTGTTVEAPKVKTEPVATRESAPFDPTNVSTKRRSKL